MLNEFQIQMILKKNDLFNKLVCHHLFSHSFSSQLTVFHADSLIALEYKTKIGKMAKICQICADRSESITEFAVNKRCSL